MKNAIQFILLIYAPIILGQPSQDITGVWERTGSTWTSDTDQFDDCRAVKFITNSRWAVIFYRPGTNEIAGTGGGTYTYRKGAYTETIEYFTFDSTAVGSQQFFSKYVSNGTLIQEGQLKTQKYDSPYNAYFRKIGELHDFRSGKDFITGTWQLIEANWGDTHRSPSEIEERYGEIIKIITPDYYYIIYFNRDKKTVGGVVFGEVSIQEKYDEKLITWSWDPTSIGSEMSFSWEIDELGVLRQSGKLAESEDYHDYTIDEYYTRIEKPEYSPKIWSDTDREYLLKNLKRTNESINEETRDLTLEQWHFKPNDSTWCIAQVVEHIGLYERIVHQEARVSFNLPARPALASTTFSDATYIDWMEEVNPHVAPINGVPLGFMKGDDNIKFFNYGRRLLINLVEKTDRDLKSYFTPRSSEQKNLRSIHSLMVVHFGHTDRHVRQIKRIKAHPDFPK